MGIWPRKGTVQEFLDSGSSRSRYTPQMAVARSLIRSGPGGSDATAGPDERRQMARRSVDVAVILPDASPVITLARLGRLDLFETFIAPIRIVDQVEYEITKPAKAGAIIHDR